jgi:hypothetical protein
MSDINRILDWSTEIAKPEDWLSEETMKKHGIQPSDTDIDVSRARKLRLSDKPLPRKYGGLEAQPVPESFAEFYAENGFTASIKEFGVSNATVTKWIESLEE